MQGPRGTCFKVTTFKCAYLRERYFDKKLQHNIAVTCWLKEKPHAHTCNKFKTPLSMSIKITDLIKNQLSNCEELTFLLGPAQYMHLTVYKHPIHPLYKLHCLRYAVGMTTSEDWNHMTQPRLNRDKAREHTHFFHRLLVAPKRGGNNKMFCPNYPWDIREAYGSLLCRGWSGCRQPRHIVIRQVLPSHAQMNAEVQRLQQRWGDKELKENKTVNTYHENQG